MPRPTTRRRTGRAGSALRRGEVHVKGAALPPAAKLSRVPVKRPDSWDAESSPPSPNSHPPHSQLTCSAAAVLMNLPAAAPDFAVTSRRALRTSKPVLTLHGRHYRECTRSRHGQVAAGQRLVSMCSVLHVPPAGGVRRQ